MHDATIVEFGCTALARRIVTPIDQAPLLTPLTRPQPHRLPPATNSAGRSGALGPGRPHPWQRQPRRPAASLTHVPANCRRWPRASPAAPRSFRCWTSPRRVRPGARLSMAVLSGCGGSGKTSLGTYWLHQVSARFPGGALYADLHGDQPEEAARPADVLAGFLRALGIPPARIPIGLDELAAQFRTVTSGRRLLVFLDNAASAAQVRAVLPGPGPRADPSSPNSNERAGPARRAGDHPVAAGGPGHRGGSVYRGRPAGRGVRRDAFRPHGREPTASRPSRRRHAPWSACAGAYPLPSAWRERRRCPARAVADPARRRACRSAAAANGTGRRRRVGPRCLRRLIRALPEELARGYGLLSRSPGQISVCRSRPHVSGRSR